MEIAEIFTPHYYFYYFFSLTDEKDKHLSGTWEKHR